jgi:hypothetical protein
VALGVVSAADGSPEDAGEAARIAEAAEPRVTVNADVIRRTPGSYPIEQLYSPGATGFVPSLPLPLRGCSSRVATTPAPRQTASDHIRRSFEVGYTATPQFTHLSRHVALLSHRVTKAASQTSVLPNSALWDQGAAHGANVVDLRCVPAWPVPLAARGLAAVLARADPAGGN